MKDPTNIDPERLLDAADVLLRAMETEPGKNALVNAKLGPGHLLRHVSTSLYTIAELVEAMAMLVRMGLVPPPAAR